MCHKRQEKKKQKQQKMKNEEAEIADEKIKRNKGIIK